MDAPFFDRLKNLCTTSGFTQKGKTFFRLVGDGVLQVVKCEYQRNLRGDIISVGLFSMYGYMQPKWFTATGCIPRYSIISCLYQNNIPLTFAIPPQTQLDILEANVLPWLDTINTQKRLISAITKLDPRWYDSLKIGPYLACDEINHAKKVIRSILAQHNFERTYRIKFCEDSQEMLILEPAQGDENLHSLLEMISRENLEEIDKYLKVNYERNIKYASFCRKKT